VYRKYDILKAEHVLGESAYCVTACGVSSFDECRYAPHNDVSVNDGSHIRRWSDKMAIV